MEPVYTANRPHEKAMQRALIQYRNPKNYKLVKEALITAGREDLIGNDRNCLIKPEKRRDIREADTKQRKRAGNRKYRKK